MIVNKNFRKIFIIIALIVLNYSFAIAKVVKWHDFTQPLKVNSEIAYGGIETIEVDIPKDIIKDNDKVKLYLDVDYPNSFYRYSEPYIKVNNSNWAIYLISESKYVNIKTKHLSSGSNIFTISFKRPSTQEMKIIELRFVFENNEEIRKKYSLNKNNIILGEKESLDKKEKEIIERKEKERKERIDKEIITRKEQEEKAKKLQKELKELKEALYYDELLTFSEKKYLQTGLKSYGLYSDDIDGIIGNSTRKSIKIYQSKLNESQTGYLKKHHAIALIDKGKLIYEKAEKERVRRKQEEIKRQKDFETLKAQLREEIKQELIEEMKNDTATKNHKYESNSKTKIANNSDNRNNIKNISEQDTPTSKIYSPFKTNSQIKFSVLIESFEDEYRSASNELKKSAVRSERKNAIKTFLNGKMRVKNWTGRLKHMGTNSEGKAFLDVVLDDSKIHLLTWDNAFSDMIHDTLIEQNTQLYSKISELTEGDKVSISGTFLSAEEDYISEQSISERGSMTEPEFTFIFESIDKI